MVLSYFVCFKKTSQLHTHVVLFECFCRLNAQPYFRSNRLSTLQPLKSVVFDIAWKRFILKTIKNFSSGLVEKRIAGIIYTRFDGLKALFVQFAIMTRAGASVKI